MTLIKSHIVRQRARKLLRVTLPAETTLAEIERFASLAQAFRNIGTLEPLEFLFTPHNGRKCVLLFNAGFSVVDHHRHTFSLPGKKKMFAMWDAVAVATNYSAGRSTKLSRQSPANPNNGALVDSENQKLVNAATSGAQKQ